MRFLIKFDLPWQNKSIGVRCRVAGARLVCRVAGARLVALLFLSAQVHAQDAVIYDDALRGSWQDFSFGGVTNFAATNPVQAGNRAISHLGSNFSAVSFSNVATFSTLNFPRLRFYLHGGASGGQQYSIALQLGATLVANQSLNSYIQGGAIAANEWRLVDVLFAQAPLSFSGDFDRISVQSQASGNAQAVVYLDEVTLLSAALPQPNIFANGFEGSDVVAPANALQSERDVSVDSMTSDRFTWRDRANQPRVAVLAHNTGQTGPGGTRGGELREYRYQVAAATRIVRASPDFASGFGYLVSHRSEGTTGIPGDDSPLGHGFTGTFSRIFEGRHHAIFRFNMSYPQYSRTNAAAPNTRYDVPVTVEWVFATGRDHPLFAQSWDLSAVPINAVETDLRAPYGQLLFDGSASAGAHSPIASVGWGDLYKFTSTTNPLSYSSAWSWNQPNTVPYVKLATAAVDATMGTVQTQTKAQQDAGGYFGADRMNTTSAGGNACSAAQGQASLMPCAFNWPYQSVNYSLSGASGTTNNTRLAWGTNFGFLGQAQYPIHGSDFYGGPLAGNPRASGYPRKGFSAFIVLGTNSSDPVGQQVAQVEVVQNTTLTAALGSVQITGPAGVNRPDSVTYSPAGWNHVYAAFALSAAANRLDANFNVGAGALLNPLLIVSNWTAGAPLSVRFNGALLSADVDYFASPRAAQNELWLTLNRSLSGAVNRLEVLNTVR